MSDDEQSTARQSFDAAISELAVIGGFSNHVSELLTGEPTTEAGQLASFVHAKMCASARSIGQLASSPMFDHSAIMTLGRVMIDSMTMYFYLRESISDDEWALRHTVLKLHDTTARIKLFRAYQPKSAHADFRAERERLIERLSVNPRVLTLTPEQRTRLLSGEEMFVGGMRATALRVGQWREDKFIAIYNYLSAHVHAAPMSYMRMRHHGTDFYFPSNAQFGFAALAIVIARACLLRVALNYLDTSHTAPKMQPGLLAKWRKENAESGLFSSGTRM